MSSLYQSNLSRRSSIAVAGSAAATAKVHNYRNVDLLPAIKIKHRHYCNNNAACSGRLREDLGVVDALDSEASSD